MNRMIVALVTVALLATSESIALAAPKGTVFDAKGLFEDTNGNYYPLGGTINIDTKTGEVVSADLVVGDGLVDIIFDLTIYTSTNAAGDVEIEVTVPRGAYIVLVVPATSLKGYSGGNLVATESYFYAPDYVYGTGVALYGGTLEPMK